MGSLLIQFHEARIADDIRYDDRHELALNALLHHGRSSYATVNISRMVASWMGGPARRPVSVIRGRIGLSASCPVYPRQRRKSRHSGSAASCQQETYAPRQTSFS